MKFNTVIGIISNISAGKDTVADYLRDKYLFERFTASDILKEVAEERGLEKNRKNLIAIAMELREKGSGKIEFVKRILEKAKGPRLVISGIREQEEIEFLRKELGDSLKIIYLNVPIELRFERAMQRNDSRDPKTLEEFKDQEREDKETYGVDGIYYFANYMMSNNGTLEELYQKLMI